MQINGTSTGPTMAASEPPEPPPRNPERINASLHKLSESKIIKSLDSTNSTNHEKSNNNNNNNRPLKPILSLDNNLITATGIGTSTTATGIGCSTGSITVAAAPALPNLQSPSSLVFNKRIDINSATNATAITGAGGSITGTVAGASVRDINLTHNSNGSSGNHTLISSMTIDNQRLSYLNKSDSVHCPLMQQQQQPQNGGSTTRGIGSLLNEQQQQQQQQQGTMTAAAASATAASAISSSTTATAAVSASITTANTATIAAAAASSSVTGQQLINGCIINNSTNTNTNSSGSINNSNSNCNTNNKIGASIANNSNTITANQINLQATAVDKRNANDVCSIVKLMDLGETASTQSQLQASTFDKKSQIMSSTVKMGLANKSVSIVARQMPMPMPMPASIETTLNNSCDSNRNNANGDNQHTKFHYNADSPNKLRAENERLSAEIVRLRKLLENSPDGAVGGVDLSDANSGDAQSCDANGGTPQQRMDRLEAELRSTKTQLLTLRIERKKLRSDKSDLLSQVKQLCSSLQDKEQELRDFIRNYQERVRESDANNAKLTGDRERERWQLLKQARDEAERSLALAQQLTARDMQLQRLQEQLQEARRQMSGCHSDQESLLSFAPLTPPSATSGMMNQMAAGAAVGLRTDDSGRGNSLSAFSGSSGATVGDRNSCSNDSVLRNNSDRESTGGDLNFSDNTCDNGPCITVDPDSISLVSSQNMYQYGTPKDRSPTLSPLNSAAYSRSVEQLGSPVDPDCPGAVARKFTAKTGTLGARNGRGGTWGSISRVFARSRNKNKALSADGTVEYGDYSWSPLSEEGYAEKLRLLREASQLPIERWRATQVLAWLEVALGMPQYSSRCAENVKSGKVLLELNDAELEAGLGLAHPMHRKKLRLAIEEQRRPELVRYPMITQLGHTWVASEWLPDIGLPQYAESFLHSLVDARMLDTLSKKELEKFLGVTRKFHQASIVHGIHVLRIVKYDRQTLAVRRVQSETVDTDPIVWTNQRFIRWAKSIDLGEYADNLKDSGVHGGLVVLEPSFSGDTMATALGIPPSKNIIRRHLSTEFDTLILPARYIIYCQMEEFQVDNSRQLTMTPKLLGR